MAERKRDPFIAEDDRDLADSRADDCRVHISQENAKLALVFKEAQNDSERNRAKDTARQREIKKTKESYSLRKQYFL